LRHRGLYNRLSFCRIELHTPHAKNDTFVTTVYTSPTLLGKRLRFIKMPKLVQPKLNV